MIDSLSSSHRRTTKSITKWQTYQRIPTPHPTFFSLFFYLGVVRRVLQLLLAGVVQGLDGTLNVQHTGIADVSPAPIQVFQPEHAAVAFLRVVVIPRSKLWGGVFSGADRAPLASIVLVVARHFDRHRWSRWWACAGGGKESCVGVVLTLYYK